MDVIAPTAERLAREEWLTIPTERAGVTTVRAKDPDALDRYHSRGELGKGDENRRRYDAGCKLRDCFHAANLEPTVIGAYRDMIAGGGMCPTEHRLGAYRAWQNAIRAVGKIASNEVIDVCCLGLPLKDRIKMEILRRGLGVLADHYGM